MNLQIKKNQRIKTFHAKFHQRELLNKLKINKMNMILILIEKIMKMIIHKIKILQRENLNQKSQIKNKI